MLLKNYLKVVLDNYANFKGRASRPEYWYFFLVNSIIGIGLGILARSMILLTLLVYIYSIGIFIPGIAVGARRMHDTNKSGWWLLLIFIPILGLIPVVYLLAQKGTTGANRYGNERDFEKIMAKFK